MKKVTLLFIAALLTGTITRAQQRINSFTIEGIIALGPSAAFNPTNDDETKPGDLQIVYPNTVDLSNVIAIYDAPVLTSPLPTDFTQTQRVKVGTEDKWALYDITCKKINPATLPYELPVGTGFSNSWTSATVGWAAARIDKGYNFPRFGGDKANLIIAFIDTPDLLNFSINAISESGMGANAIFDVEESADGIEWKNLIKFDASNPMAPSNGSQEEKKKEVQLDKGTRYVRFLYTKRDGANIALTELSITKGEDLPLPEPTPAMTISSEQAIKYTAGSLSTIVQQLEITGTSDNVTVNNLLIALGNNQNITSIRFEALNADVGSNDFSAINTNCLKYIAAEISTAPTGWTNVVADTKAITPIIIEDGKPFITLGDITDADVTYSRDCHKDGGWETIILPFSVVTFPEFDDYIVETYSGKANNNTIRFTELISLTEWEANEAYIMKYKTGTGNVDDVQTCIFNNPNATINTNPSASEFTGVYRAVPGKVDEVNKYILNSTGTELRKGSDQSTVPPFRAYYLPSEPQSAPAFSVEHQGEATNMAEISQASSIYSVNGILYIHSSENAVADIYNIDGTKIRSIQLIEGENQIHGLTCGAYVIYNQIIIIK